MVSQASVGGGVFGWQVSANEMVSSGHGCLYKLITAEVLLNETPAPMG
jgi:hypothetical protein